MERMKEQQEMSEWRSHKHDEAWNSLPDDLKAEFDALVSDYKFFADKHHRKPFVSYVVLADLIRVGWRLAGPSAGELHQSEKSPKVKKNG